MIGATVRMLVLAAIAICLSASPARAQWISIYSDEPHNLSYDHLTELSNLLQLDATMHELLIELHLEMIRAESAERKKVRDLIERLNEEGDDVGWRESMRLSIEMTDDFTEIGDRFFEDVRLMVLPEQVALVDHIRARSDMSYLFDDIGDEVSGLGAQPFELLHETQAITQDRFRELALELAPLDQQNHKLFNRAFETILELQQIGMETDFDMDDASPDQMAKMIKMFKDTIEIISRLRDANEDLADRIMDGLTEDQRTAFEAAWLEKNYEDVQERSPAERAVEAVTQDEEASPELRTRIEEIRPNFERRLATARKMARIAKRKSDLDFDIRQLMETGDRNTEVYDDALERLLGVAESYASALKGVMTPEQQERYGLVAPQEASGIGAPQQLR